MLPLPVKIIGQRCERLEQDIETLFRYCPVDTEKADALFGGTAVGDTFLSAYISKTPGIQPVVQTGQMSARWGKFLQV